MPEAFWSFYKAKDTVVTLLILLRFLELNIAGNQLVHLEASLLTNQCELENIHLGYSVSNGMDISSSLFYNNEELKRVDLTNGRSSIPSQLFLPLPKVEWLSLDGNFIPVLTPLLLRKKKKLEYLTMAECEIEAVLDSTFHEAKSLQILIMRNNNIKYLTAGQLKGLESLQHIGEHKTIHDSAKNCNNSLWFLDPIRKTWASSNSLF